MNARPSLPRRIFTSFLFNFFLVPFMLSTAVRAQAPSFTMSLSPETVGIGSCAELTFEVQNASATAVNDLAFTLNLPAGVILSNPANPVSDCGGVFVASDGGNTITLSGGSVNANATCFASVGVILLAEGPFDLISGDLTSDAGNSGIANASIGIPSTGPALGFTKSFSESPVRLGGQTTLIYTIQNQSQTDAEGISFSDDLSPGIVVASQPNILNNCTGSTLTAIAGSQTINFSGATLAAGQTCVISVDVVGITAGRNISISGDISSRFSGGNPVSSGRACGALQVIPSGDLADISFSKSFVEGSVDPGGKGALVFTVTNNSQTETFTDIAFTDDLNAMLPGAVASDLPEEGGFLVDAGFDGSGSSILDTSWDYLDQLQNENGRNDDYPIDGSGNEWNTVNFNPSSSSIGPWVGGNAPFQAGVIDAFPPGTPAVLGGIDAATNGENLVTTYLFRNEFTLDASDAGVSDWLLDYVFDDGAIVYINGTEVFRSAGMPAGPVTTTTLSALGEEASRSSSQVDLSGVLWPGSNTIAVELHQTTLDSSDAGFSLDLLPVSSSPTGGFSYADDAFEGTNDTGAANGSLNPTGGFSGGGIDVTVGGKNFFTGLFNPASSGGWSRTFTVNEPGSIEVSVRYRLLVDETYEGDEFGQALLEVDGVRYGNSANNSLAQLNGGAGVDQDSGWQVYTTNVLFTAGEHTILLGAYNNKSNSGTEVTQVFFDDIRIGSPVRPAAVCGPNSQIVGSDVLSFSGGQLAPGQSCSFQVGVDVPVTAPFGNYENKTSLISTVVGGRTLVGFPATDTLNVVPVPPVFSSAFSPADIPLNGTSTLTFTINNQGSRIDATGVTFSGNLPEGMLIAASPGASSTCGGVITAQAGSNNFSFSGGTIVAGQVCEVTIDVTGQTLGDLVCTSENLVSSLGDSGTASTTLTVNPPPAFTMSFGPEAINAGQISTLTFVIDNSGSQLAATNLNLSHELPAGLVLANPSNATTTCQGGTLIAISGTDQVSYSGGTVPAGQTCIVTVGVTTNEGGDYSNTTQELTSSLGNSGSASASLGVQSIVSIVVSVAGSTETVVAGSGQENLTYFITARNNGPSEASGILIRQADMLPAGAIAGNAVASLGTVDQSIWTIPSLASGQSATLAISYTVAGSTRPGTDTISASATLISVDQLDFNDADNSASDPTSVSNVFDIALSKTESIDPVLAASGPGNLVYTITASNSGPSDASNVNIREALNLPEGVTVQSIVPSLGTFAPDNDPNGLWTLDLPLGETASLTVTLTVDADAPDNGMISSTASLESASGTDSNSSNNSVTETTTIIAGIDLIVNRIGSDDPVVAGSSSGNLSYLIEVTNQGPLDATGLELTEVLTFGEGIVIDSITPSVGTFENQTWSVGNLAVGTSETLEVIVTVGPSAEVASPGFSSISSVSAVDQAQINTGDESVTASRDVTREVDLTVSAENSRDPVLAGFNLPQNLFHTLTVTNQGPSDASGVSLNLSEILPEGATVDSISPAIGISFEDSLWTVGDLGVGTSSSIIYYFQVPGTVTGGVDLISNEAAVNSANEPLLNPDDDTGSIATDIVSPASTTIVGGAIALDLQTGLFKQTVTITNNNPGALPAFRILVGGLPDGVTVFNAQGEFLGSSLLLFNQALESGESIELTVEYLQADASGDFEPTFEIELLDPVENQNAGEGVEVDRCEVLANGDVLIEFPSQIGATYTVQYSQNGELWTKVIPDVVAGGTRLQWIDNGPPKTASHPSGEKLRLYRVIKKDADQ